MRICECGCKGTTQGGNFLPGHDQRLRTSLEDQVGGVLGMRDLVEAVQRYQVGEISEMELGRIIRTQFAGKLSAIVKTSLKASCRDEILEAAQSVMAISGLNHFTIVEIVEFMKSRNTRFAESTIRTHVVSRMCANAPVNHAVTYRDLLRTDRGEYQLLNKTATQ